MNKIAVKPGNKWHRTLLETQICSYVTHSKYIDCQGNIDNRLLEFIRIAQIQYFKEYKEKNRKIHPLEKELKDELINNNKNIELIKIEIKNQIGDSNNIDLIKEKIIASYPLTLGKGWPLNKLFEDSQEFNENITVLKDGIRAILQGKVGDKEIENIYGSLTNIVDSDLWDTIISMMPNLPEFSELIGGDIHKKK